MYGPIVPLLIAEPELRKMCYRAYSNWLAEFCATAPERLCENARQLYDLS
jgi:hypothetical protein